MSGPVPDKKPSRIRMFESDKPDLEQLAVAGMSGRRPAIFNISNVWKGRFAVRA